MPSQDLGGERFRSVTSQCRNLDRLADSCPRHDRSRCGRRELRGSLTLGTDATKVDRESSRLASDRPRRPCNLGLVERRALFQREDDDALTRLGTDVGVQTHDIHTENAADHRVEQGPALLDQFLSDLLD